MGRTSSRPYGSRKPKKAYQKIIGEWLAKEGPFTPKADDPVTVEKYWRLLALRGTYYGYNLNPKRGDCCNLKSTMGSLTGTMARTAKDFGPLCLRAVQDEMICRAGAGT